MNICTYFSLYLFSNYYTLKFEMKKLRVRTFLQDLILSQKFKVLAFAVRSWFVYSGLSSSTSTSTRFLRFIYLILGGSRSYKLCPLLFLRVSFLLLIEERSFVATFLRITLRGLWTDANFTKEDHVIF
jgi:hypothetical protein